MQFKTTLKYSLLAVFGIAIYNNMSAQAFTEISDELGIDFFFEDFNDIGGGTAWFDYDNDGDEDLYISAGRFRDLLYRNNGDGTFTEVGEEAGLFATELYFTIGVATGDTDNDGDREIFVTTQGLSASPTVVRRNLFFLNNGDGTFTEISAQANIGDASRSISATFVDHDRDGFLDIYVANYVRSTGFIFDNNGEISGFDHNCFPNFFYHNNGNNTFTEVAFELGLDDEGCGLATTNTDFDQDGDSDIYAINDFGEFVVTNQMYINNDTLGTFDTITTSNNDINIGLYGMGVATGDYDHDGDLDYYISNLGSNALLRNNGSGFFQDVASAAGVINTFSDEQPLLATSWGNAFMDIDNDTYEDLFVANGHITAAEFIATDVTDPNKLYYNRGDGTFEDISETAGVATTERSRGMAYADYDQDGDLDMFVNNISQEDNPDNNVRFYRNELENDLHWVQITLEGTRSNRDAYGSQLYLYTDDLVLIREVQGGNSHASQHSTVAHFGLGEFEAVDSLAVVWPTGERETFFDLAIDQRHHFVESAEAAVRITFNVDMSWQPEAESGVFLRIRDTDGNTKRRLMYSPFEDAQYSVTFLEDAGFTGHFTVFNGNCPDGDCREDLSERGCGDPNLDFERVLTSVTQDTTINLCFGICPFEECQSTVDSFNVHFSVNAVTLDEDLDEIFLVGVDPDGLPLQMEDEDGDGRYDLELTLPEAYSTNYIYTSDICPDLSCAEDLSVGDCAIEQNNMFFRYLPPIGQDTMLNACFGECNADSCFAPIDTFQLRINLNMTNEDIHPTGVYIVGDYFGEVGTTPMFDGNDDGIYTNFFEIPEDIEIAFTFVNGSFCPTNDCEEDLSGLDCENVDENNFRLFGPFPTDTVLNFCFDQCELADCFPTIDSVDITFNVNMGLVETISPDGVFWLDSFDPPGDVALTDDNGDNIYTLTIRQPEGYSTFYSFTNGLCSDLSCRENITDQACADPFELDYRFLPPVTEDTVLDLCFGNCNSEQCTPPPAPVNVTFEVNMAGVPTSTDGVRLIVSDDNLDYEFAMEDPDGDDVYTYIWEREEGYSGYYGFFNGNCPDFSCQEDLSGLACAYPDWNNFRYLPPVAQDTLIQTCFGECTDNLSCTLPPEPVNITFQVRMIAQSGFDAVGVDGDFVATPITMSDIGQDNYAVEVAVLPGEYLYHFWYTAGLDTLRETITPDSCSVLIDGIANRNLMVIENVPQTLDLVCFDACESCEIVDNVTLLNGQVIDFTIQPNPTQGDTRLVSTVAPTQDLVVQIYHPTGQRVQSLVIPRGERSLVLPTAVLPPGVYWIQISDGVGQISKRILVQ